MTTASSYSALVQELYVAYFGRPADAAGLVNFENALLAAKAPTDITSLTGAYGSNAAIKSLIDSFGNSAESAKLYGTVDSSLSSAEAFVTAVFDHVLNRAPASAGLQFWAEAILSGSLSIGNAALSIAAGAQANTTTQGKLDAQTIVNKLAVATEFTAAVADTAGMDEYKGSGAANVGRTLLAGVDNTVDPTAYLPNVQSAVFSLLGTGTPYTLTTGVDSLTGTTSNNLFNAILDNTAGQAAGGTAATLNTGDTIVGGSGVNTLSINDESVGSSLAIPKGLNLTNITDLSIASAESLGVQDFSGWSGLNAVVVSKSSGSAVVTLGSSTVLSLSDTGAAGSISTIGGSTVSIHTDTGHVVNVKGGAATTAVSVTGGSNVQIVDGSYGTTAANSIAAVTVVSPTGSVTVESTALTSFALTGDKGQAVSVLTSGSGALALNMNGDVNTLINENAQTLALTTSGAASSGINFTAAAATALDFALGADLALTTLTASDAKTLAISGAGAFSADLRNLAPAAAIDASTSSGAITVTIGQQQSFTGGTGKVQLTTTSLPTVALEGGTATSNTIDFQNVTAASNAVVAAVKDFATWEISGTSSGTFDMRNAVGVQAVDVQGLGGNLTISHAVAAMPLTIDLAGSSTYGVTLATADSTGASDAASVNLGATTDAAQGIAQLKLQDNAGNGIGSLSVASNSSGSAPNVIGSIVDANLHALTLSGNTALSLTGALSDTATSITITNSAGKAASVLAGLSDSALTSLAIAGSEAVQITALSSTASSLTLSDSGTGAATVSGLGDAALTSLSISSSDGAIFTLSDNAATLLHSLTLSGGVALNIAGDTLTSGITVSGLTDNAAASFTSSGATASGVTDTVSLGSGSDQVTLGAGVAGSIQSITLGGGLNDSVASSTQGKLNVTLGTAASGTDYVTASGNGAAVTIVAGNGSNSLTLSGSGDTVSISAGTGANTIHTGTAAGGAVSFASHSAADTLAIGTVGQSSSAASTTVVAAVTGVPAHLAGSLVVTGLNASASDVIVFSGGTVSAVEQVTLAEVQSAGADTSTLAGWIAAATGQNGVVPQNAGGVVWFQEGGNTYLIDTAAASDAGVLKGTDAVVELSGTSYSFGSGSIGTGGAFLLKSGSGGSTPATATFTLTTGTDSFTGNASTNTFNATLGSSATLNAGDTLAGGASGSVNILNITDSGTGGTTTIPGGATIGGMTVLNIQSAEAVNGSYASWSNLGTLNVTASVGTDNLTAGSNTSVSIIDAGTTVDLNGGKSALIKDVNYGTATANTLATVALTNLGGAATIDSNVLTSLSVTGTGFGATVNAAAGTRTLGLTLDGAGGNATFADATATTVNLTASTAASSQAYFSLAAATTIAVTDTAGLNDSQTPWTAQQAFVAGNAGSVSISGAGLFAANLSGLKSTASVDASASSGTVDVALSAGQSFTGGTGTDLIAVTGTPTGTVSGGTAADNEILLVNDGAATISALAHVSHVSIIGVAGTTSGTFDMTQFVGPVGSYDVNQDTASAAITFTNAQTGSALSIEGNFGNTVTLQTADANGGTDSVNVTLGAAGGSAITISEVTLEDSTYVGTYTVSLDALSAATITTLEDANVGTLYFSGDATTIGNLHTFSSTFTVDSNDSTATITSLTANALTKLTMAGAAAEHFGTISSTSTALEFDDNNTAAIVMGTLSDSQLTTLTLQNSVNTVGGTFTVTSSLSAPLMTLNLNGNVGLTVVDSATPSGPTGITVSGSTDNAAVSFSSSDATPSATTDSITLGNGNDTVTLSGGLAGSTHGVTLGTGADTVTDSTLGTLVLGVTGAAGAAEHVTANSAANVTFTLGDGNNTVSALAATTVSIIAGNGSNSITATAAGAGGAIAVGTGVNTIAINATGVMSIAFGANAGNGAISSISGIAAGDTINFAGDAGMSGTSSVVGISATDVTNNAGNASALADWISASLANLAQHQVATFEFGGNTYLVEQSATGNAQTLPGNTVIELIGSHNEVGATISGHLLTIG